MPGAKQILQPNPEPHIQRNLLQILLLPLEQLTLPIKIHPLMATLTKHHDRSWIILFEIPS